MQPAATFHIPVFYDEKAAGRFILKMFNNAKTFFTSS